jgi:predicted RNA binding protein YcfA (HicA-like mRNA interferase family)
LRGQGKDSQIFGNVKSFYAQTLRIVFFYSILNSMHAKQILKILKASGWSILRQEGSHIRLGKAALRTTVPMHGARDVSPGVLAAIERQTGIKLK